MNDYCSPPPFLSSGVHPNVMISLDSSGSMGVEAYPGSYDPSKFESGKYYGYFDSDKFYKYDGSKWAVTTDDLSEATVEQPIASGDLLNWATMRRIDVAKKILMGGRTSSDDPVSGDSVKLYSEPADITQDRYTTIDNFDNSTKPGIIAPFKGSYDYQMRVDELTIISKDLGTENSPRPTGTIIAPAAWTVSGASTTFEAVDEISADDGTSFISNSSTSEAILFDYGFDPSAAELETSGDLDIVRVIVRARKTDPAGTFFLQAALQIDGASYPSTTTEISSEYATYEFTYEVNPQTSSPWQWSDLKPLLSAAETGQISGFGVQADTLPSGGMALEVSQVYLELVPASSSSGPYRVVVDQGSTPATGLIQNLGDRARFGLAFYDGNEAARIVNDIDFNSADAIVANIDSLVPGGNTPLAETVFEILGYFRQDTPYYASSPYSVGPGHDPYNYQYSKVPSLGFGVDKKVKCAKSFILLLTDGLSTQDRDIPDAIPGAADTETRTLKDFDEDGNDTTFTSSDGSDYLDDVALWGRTTDLRDDDDLPGSQNVYLYPVFMFGGGERTLIDAAINGGFDDLNGDSMPGPDLKEYLRDSNGDGVLSDDGSDLPQTYFEGDDGYELENSIADALTEILERAASGTAVSLLSSSNRGAGSMLNAYYQSSVQDGTRKVEWTGYAQSVWIDNKDNLREDTVTDAKLQLHRDNVVKMYFDQDQNEAKAAVFTTDEYGLGGTLEACGTDAGVDIEYKAFNDLTPLWEAGLKLSERDPDTRNIFTSKKVISSTATTSILTNDFTVDNVTVAAAATLGAALDADATYSESEIVRYIRGENLEAADSKFRDRRLTAAGMNPWRLGDIVNSTPKTISNFPVNSYHSFYGDLTYFNYFTSGSYGGANGYRNRASVAVMGANDGMVHAFRVGYLKENGLSEAEQAAKVKAKFINDSTTTSADELGEEIWGYIPFNAFPYLKYLANPEYCHIYYNDLSLRLLDASINGNPGDVRAVTSWKSLLLGGMRFGGSCATSTTPAPPAGVTDVGYSAYYALDVTDPEDPQPLWEFSADDLGYATTYPAIVRTGNPGDNGSWYAVVGSGSKTLPKSGTDIARDSAGYLYFINLETGALVKKIGLGHNAIVGDILSVDADKDYRSEKLYFGTSYNTGSGWHGKLMSMVLPANLADLCGPGPVRTAAECVAATGSDLTVLFENVYPFTASPDAIKGEKNQTWVFQGSGKYYSDVDIDTDEQIFLGMKDLSRTLDLSDLDDSATKITRGVRREPPEEYCLYDDTEKIFKKTDVYTAVSPVRTYDPSTYGWYLKLTNGERVISRPLGIGGLVDFLTYRPQNADPCTASGETYLYAVDYRNGVAPAEVAIPLSGALDPDSDDSSRHVVKKGIRLGPGAPPTGEGIVLTPPRRGDKSGLRNKKIQVGSGVIHEAQNNPIFDVNSQIIHWLEK